MPCPSLDGAFLLGLFSKKPRTCAAVSYTHLRAHETVLDLDLCSAFHSDNVSYPRADFSRFYNDRESDRETITVVFLDK